MLDQTDYEILEMLKKNARYQWREIGEQVHLTGQAVANRIRRMEEFGVIQGYTVKVDPVKEGKVVTAFVTIFMKTTDHAAFIRFVKQSPAVVEANRTSGEGCYLLKVNAATQEELLQFLDEVLAYGNYRVNLSIEDIK
ncbi:MAG: Lrp/AsnC family transcriptional regulator [Bacillota bacterium]